MINFIKDKCSTFWAVLVLMLTTEQAYAVQSGTALSTTASTFVTSITGALTPVGIGIATIAIFIFGYQVSFGGKSPAAAAPVLIGGVIIGAASLLAGTLVGGA